MDLFIIKGEGMLALNWIELDWSASFGNEKYGESHYKGKR